MIEQEGVKINVEETPRWINVDGTPVTLQEAIRRIKAKDKEKRRLSEG